MQLDPRVPVVVSNASVLPGVVAKVNLDDITRLGAGVPRNLLRLRSGSLDQTWSD